MYCEDNLKRLINLLEIKIDLSDKDKLESTAVVLGAGTAGIISAALLARRYSKVVLIDKRKDFQNNDQAPKKNFHVHHLLKAGELLINRIFPGFTQKLKKDETGLELNYFKDIVFAGMPLSKAKPERPLNVITVSKNRLDSVLAEYIKEVSNLERIFGVTNIELECTDSMVTRVKYYQDDKSYLIEPSIVVNCTGASDEQFAYYKTEESCKVNAYYCSAVVSRQRQWKSSGIICLPDENENRFLVGMPIENNRSLVTLGLLNAPSGYSIDGADSFKKFFGDVVKQYFNESDYELNITQNNLAEYGLVTYLQRQIFLRTGTGKLHNLYMVGDASCGISAITAQGGSMVTIQAFELFRLLSSHSEEEYEAVNTEYAKVRDEISLLCWQSALLRGNQHIAEDKETKYDLVARYEEGVSRLKGVEVSLEARVYAKHFLCYPDEISDKALDTLKNYESSMIQEFPEMQSKTLGQMKSLSYTHYSFI